MLHECQAKDGRTLTADYTHFVSKPAGGLVDATVDVMDRGLKLTGGYGSSTSMAFNIISSINLERHSQ